jgi:geranylgeranyl diphosphate synthase type II
MNTAEQITKKVNEYIDNMPYERRPQSLYEPIRYVLSLGGKRIRPVLMMLGYALFKDDPESIVQTAVGLETYHNFTLLHDDVMDNAPMRRGQPTVHERWDANTAILSGDTMLVTAYQHIARCPSDKLPEVIDLFTKTALEIDEGQQYDVEFESRDDVTEAEYIEMIRLKTSVLLACALKMGALLAGASEQDARLLYRFGENIGLAFQLQDDYLDVYGDPATFGKRIGGDILSNKKTYMLINALLKADDNQRRELDRWIHAEQYDPEEKIAAVTRLYNEIGIDLLAQEKINHYFDQGKTLLDAVSVGEERKQELRAYVARMMKRNK